MRVSSDQLISDIVSSGLMSEVELSEHLDSLPAEKRSSDAGSLALELVNRRVLTKYQAKMLLMGKATVLVLGNYVLTEKIGEGGMGQVVKATDRRSGRVAAVKVLRPDMMESTAVTKRFRQEADVARKISHDNIVTAYDADEEKGVHYLAMEFVEGRDLSSIMEEGLGLSLPQVMDYIIQTARGLEYAHNHGIIHRDIKPSNLLVDLEGVVKISDMGLARIQDDDAGSMGATLAERLTQQGQVLGTIDYMSPEQATDTAGADHRSDIYSLGCTLYHLLAGKPIYAGETPIEKVMAHCEAEIPSLRDAVPGAPVELDQVLAKMVAKKPEDRYQSMTDLLADLEACPLPELSTVAPDSPGHNQPQVAAVDDATGAWEGLAGAKTVVDRMEGEPVDNTIAVPDAGTIPMSDSERGARTRGATKAIQPVLQMINGPDAGKKFQLDKLKMRMGRHPDCEVFVDSMECSRYHAQVLRADDGWALEDLGSRNGTLLNDDRVLERQTLRDGDRIGIGDVTLIFHLGDPTV
jgi:serine/threonine-protein kinase